MIDYKEIMRHEIDDQKFTAGVNMLVLKDGKEVAYEQYGYRDLENKIPFSRDTIMRLFSMSKPVTAAAVMILVDRGLLDLASCICWMLPDFKEAYYRNENNERIKASAQITVKDLLNMTSGLPYPSGGDRYYEVNSLFGELVDRLYTDNQMTTAEWGKRMASVDPIFNPGDGL